MRKPYHRLLALACGATLMVAATVLITGTVNVPQSRAATCTKGSLVLNFITYGYTDPLTNYSPAPNTCWGYNRLVQNTSTFEICAYPSGGLTGSGPNRVFDDTNPTNNHTSEGSALNTCKNNSPPQGSVYAEYLGVNSSQGSSCTTNCWYKDTDSGAVSVKKFYAETYADQTHVANMFTNWQNGVQSGVSPSTTAGTINISPFIYNYGNGLYHDWSALTNWIVKLCNATAVGYMSVYGGGGLTVAGTAEQTIINAMNSCTTS
jgi:hypothetical protein